MSLIEAIDPLYSISGFGVGVLVGMTGIGGGSLMTPLLILLFGIHPATAVGTDLLFAATTKVGGSLVHGVRGSIDWVIVRRLASGSVPAAAATLDRAVLCRAAKPGRPRAHHRRPGRGAFTHRAGADFPQVDLVAFYARASANCVRAAPRSLPCWSDRSWACWSRFRRWAPERSASPRSCCSIPHGMAKLVGSDIAHAVPLTLIAGIGHWIVGSIDWHIYASLIVGSLPGIVLGSYVATRIHETALRMIVAAALLFVGGKLMMTPHPDHTGSTAELGMRGR